MVHSITDITIDIEDRFQDELRELQIMHGIKEISLAGDEMLKSIAKRLLLKYSYKIKVVDVKDADDSVQSVMLLSMESYGTLFLSHFLDETPLPKAPYLLTSIPESYLVAYASQHKIPIVILPKSDVRVMLDNIAKQQPQTFFSLAKSAKRLELLHAKDF